MQLGYCDKTVNCLYYNGTPVDKAYYNDNLFYEDFCGSIKGRFSLSSEGNYFNGCFRYEKGSAKTCWNCPTLACISTRADASLQINNCYNKSVTIDFCAQSDVGSLFCLYAYYYCTGSCNSISCSHIKGIPGSTKYIKFTCCLKPKQGIYLCTYAASYYSCYGGPSSEICQNDLSHFFPETFSTFKCLITNKCCVYFCAGLCTCNCPICFCVKVYKTEDPTCILISKQFSTTLSCCKITSSICQCGWNGCLLCTYNCTLYLF